MFVYLFEEFPVKLATFWTQYCYILLYCYYPRVIRKY